MKIKKGRSTYHGVKINEQGDICCEVCGGTSDLKMVMHMDYTDKYISDYKCKCGNVIEISTKRTKEERMFWE